MLFFGSTWFKTTAGTLSGCEIPGTEFKCFTIYFQQNFYEQRGYGGGLPLPEKISGYASSMLESSAGYKCIYKKRDDFI